MKLLYNVILILTNIYYVAAQNIMTQKLKGTFIYAVICEEGIVLTADSRANFSDEGKRIFYIDNLQKLFVSGEFIIAYAGTKHSFRKFVESHISKMDDKVVFSPKDWMFQFALILQNEYSTQEYNLIMKNMGFIIGGLDEKGLPSLCGTKDKELTYINEGIITNHNLERDDLFFSKLNFQESITVIKKDIQTYVKANNSELDIGGPLTTITMDNNGIIKYFENPKTIIWTSFDEMKKYLLNNLDTIHPINNYTIDDAETVLNKK